MNFNKDFCVVSERCFSHEIFRILVEFFETKIILQFQVKDDILNEVIYCPAEKAVLLASYQVQSKFIDYDPEAHPTGYLANEKLLCKTVVDQHKLSMEEWEEKISSFHKQHRVW